MIKGVSKRIIEIKSPNSRHIERAVLFLRSGSDCPDPKELGSIEEEYLREFEPKDKPRPSPRFRAAVAVLALSLGVTLAALMIVLVLYTKM